MTLSKKINELTGSQKASPSHDVTYIVIYKQVGMFGS